MSTLTALKTSTVKLCLPLLICLFSLPFRASGQCNVVRVDARNSIVNLNCGGTQRIIRGDAEIRGYLHELNERMNDLIQLVQEKEDRNEDFAEELKEMKDYLLLVFKITNQIKTVQENGTKITRSAVVIMLRNGHFFEACVVLQEAVNQPEFNSLREIACQLNQYKELTEEALQNDELLRALRYANLIKTTGGKWVSSAVKEDLCQRIKTRLEEVVTTRIIKRFDDVNCSTCPLQKSNRPEYLDIYDSFQKIYDFDPANFQNWFDQDLKWFVYYFPYDGGYKAYNSEVLYKICFMFHHDFYDINRRKVAFKHEWLSKLINLSIQLNDQRSDLSKKDDLRRSIIK